MARRVDEAFRDHLHQALATAMRTAEQTQPYHDRLRKFVKRNTTEEALDAMLSVYYDDHEKLEQQGGKDAVYISGSTFELLVTQRIEASLFYDPWLQEALKLLNRPTLVAERGDRFRARFDRLQRDNSVLTSNIRLKLTEKIKLKRQSLTFFEILVDLYALKNGLPPEEEHQMLAFQPALSEPLKKEYDTKIGALYYELIVRKDPEGAEKALNEFGRWASQVQDVARAFQILKWSRDTVVRLSARPHSLHAWLFNEIYLISIQRAVMTAINCGYHKVQTSFLRLEEIDLLLHPLMTSYYFSDYADRLYPFANDGARAGGVNFIGLSALHIYLLLFADSRGIRLLSSKERDGVADQIIAEPSILDRTMWITGNLAAAARSVKRGKIGSSASLVLVEGRGLIVSIEGIEHHLFHVDMTVAGKWLDQYLVDQLLEGTQHLLVLIPAFFDLLQYTHVFITGGISGLIEELIEDQVAELAADIVYKYTGNEKLQMAVGALGNPSTILVPSRGLARMVGKAGTRSVRKVQAAWKTRQGLIPHAKVIPKKKVPKVRSGRGPHVPKAQKPKKFTAEQEKQILAHEVELKKLSKRKVRLGNRKGKSFDRLSGVEAVKKLFRDKISEIPRIAQHWPKNLQKQYVDEIKTAIKNGLQHNPKLWNEVKKKLDKNILDQDVLNLLPHALRKEIKGIVKKRWDDIRKAFWKSVRSDNALVKELKELGIRFEGTSAGSAPDLTLAGVKMKCSLDHVKRKVENPLEAFSADNLRILTGRDNSVLKEGIVRNIRKTTDLDLDAYSANTMWGKDKVPKEYKKGLADVLNDAPEEGDIWRSFEDPDPPPPLMPPTPPKP
ncbi:hypothetical protein [Microvirga guangxiensis]|uniref:Uncharacterized protein n=1 Tax=Microvirga guangxiensis TaxID=549386 RepID=A0A1G5KM92_9HYPH|nr:hypothetical protein [Microvirga guangxiensis]SCZ01311.1 hypothetical protein SAMN02927923_03425 [Microvirga guangxiensis]